MAVADRALVFEQVDPTKHSVEWLRSQGLAVDVGRAMWQRDFQRYTEDEIITAAQGYDAVMGASGAQFSRRVLEALPQLRCISKFGIGVDSIDVEAASELGILVSHTGGDTQTMPVSEHAIALMLALRKQLHVWTPQFMQAGGWRADTFASYLAGTTVGLVGLGRIGRGVAQRLAGWSIRLLAHDPYAVDAPPGVELVSLEELLGQSDVVSLHAPATPANRHMIDARALARMKPSAILINTGRAGLVDYQALREALATGSIAGAALDVFDREPPDPADPLLSMRNVMVTPHVAAWTFEGVQNMGWQGARNLWAMLRGLDEANLVNPEAVGHARRAQPPYPPPPILERSSQ
ncbi:MAG: hydroxyacid dehydrogenase [Pseudomonadota bacterium]